MCFQANQTDIKQGSLFTVSMVMLVDCFGDLVSFRSFWLFSLLRRLRFVVSGFRTCRKFYCVKSSLRCDRLRYESAFNLCTDYF